MSGVWLNTWLTAVKKTFLHSYFSRVPPGMNSSIHFWDSFPNLSGIILPITRLSLQSYLAENQPNHTPFSEFKERMSNVRNEFRERSSCHSDSIVCEVPNF